jgi:NAD(P)-dependent dehydrogenase (short-subunit alcohol dehydrogenase family)
MENRTSKQKVWFITGASSGMGLALTKLVLSKGDKVAATSRNIEELETKITENKEHLLPLQVDITSDESVKGAVKQTIEKFGKLDVVVNNAGYVLLGSLEEITDKEFREVLDVNLFGTVNVIRAVMPYLRMQQFGHIINFSSNAGYVGMANVASYNAGKFAVIGISEALHNEVEAFGIKVTVVAPGEIRTNLWASGHLKSAKNKVDAYKSEKLEKTLSLNSGKQQGDPEKLVNIFVDIANNPNPPLHLLLGPDTYQMVIDQREKEKQEIETWKEVTLSTNFKDWVGEPTKL